jgi:putative ABC transport system permease protein
MPHLLQDARLAARLLWRSPSFTLTALATIALGIGANAAVFTIVQALLLRPLPYPDPDRLVTVWQDLRARGGPVDEWATPGNLVDWRAEDRLFSGVASMRGWGPTLTGAGDPEPLTGEQVTDNYFTVLGMSALRGRTFLPSEGVPNAPRVAVISHGLWQRRFGGDEQIVGRRMVLGGEPHEIVGVMPPGFRPAVIPGAEIWRPDRLNLANPSRGAIVLRVVARLAPGAGVDNARPGMTVITLHERTVGSVRLWLLTLFGAVVLVLLVACVNIANLLLARASGRAREMATRAALGAGRGRVVRQLLTESLLLAVAGSVLGLVVGYWTVQALVAMAPAGTPRLDVIAIDGRVLLFTALLTFVTGTVFGLAPAWQLSRVALSTTLASGARGSVGASGSRLRQALIVSEVAVALMLLAGSGLLLRSFLELRRSDLGFDPHNVLVGFVSPPPARYPTPEQRIEFVDRAVERATHLPGVTTAAVTSIIPLNGGDSDMTFSIEGRPPAATPDEEPVTWYRTVSHAYFEAMGIRLTSGRAFAPREAAPSAIVNESLARRFWPGGDPIGRRIKFESRPDAPWFTIIGVVADVKQTGARAEPRLQTFLPYWQTPQLAGGMSLVLKTATSPESLVPALRSAIREIDPDIPVAGVTTMSALVADSLGESRFLAWLVTLFAGLAVLVAAVGVYGLLSYAVNERRQEIGVRVALGAERISIFGLVIGQGLRLVLLGVALGVAGGLVVAPALGSLLFGVRPADPATFAVTVLVLLGVAFLAALVPARRATRVDPIVALRGD